MGDYSVSNDPREKLKKKLEQDKLNAAIGQQGATPAAANPAERPWVPVLGPDKPTAPMARPPMAGAPASIPPQGQMGPPTPDQGARERIMQNSTRSAILAKRMEYERATSGDTRGLAGERHSLGLESDALGQSIRPIAQPQTPTQVTEGRWGMHNQATDIVGKQRQRAMEAEKAGDYETSRRLYADAERMEGAFKRDLSPYSGPEDPQVSGIIQRQREGMPRQEAGRAAWAGEAGKLTDQNLASEARSREAMTAKMEQQRLQERLGQETTKGEIAATQYAADPKVMEANTRAKIAEAQTGAALAERKQRMVNGGSGATPEEAAMHGQQREAALAMAGINGTEGLQKLVEQATATLSDIRQLDPNQSAASAEVFQRTSLPLIRKLAQGDPALAAEIANQILANVKMKSADMPSWYSSPLYSVPKAALSAGRDLVGGQRLGVTLKILEQIAAGGH